MVLHVKFFNKKDSLILKDEKLVVEGQGGGRSRRPLSGETLKGKRIERHTNST